VQEEGYGVPTPYVGGEVDFPQAYAALSGGTWMQPTGAVVVDTAGIAGVVGASQNASLTANQMQVDGSSAFTADGTPMWTSPAAASTYPTVTSTASAPFVELVAPTAGTTVSGTVTMTANASATAGIQGVSFAVDGTDVGCDLTTEPYACAWDTTQVPNGQHYFAVLVEDAGGNISDVYNLVTVQN
jgi:hypothetical protein